MTPTLTDGQIEGTVHVCAHYVTYRYWSYPEGCEVDDETLEQLEESAEERIKECIIQGYVAGQLCATVPSEDGDELELNGWWEIDRS